jgi:hypothetical protein
MNVTILLSLFFLIFLNFSLTFFLFSFSLPLFISSPVGRRGRYIFLIVDLLMKGIQRAVRVKAECYLGVTGNGASASPDDHPPEELEPFREPAQNPDEDRADVEPKPRKLSVYWKIMIHSLLGELL